MLSGSLWKGHKLKIQAAKPDFADRYAPSFFAPFLPICLRVSPHNLTSDSLVDRLATERAAAQEEAENPAPRKKAKRNPDPLVGNNAKHFELVTVDNIKKHKVTNSALGP